MPFNIADDVERSDEIQRMRILISHRLDEKGGLGHCLKAGQEMEEAKVPGGPKRRNVNHPKSCDLHAARD